MACVCHTKRHVAQCFENGCEWPLSDKLVNKHKKRSDRWKKSNFPLTELEMNYCSMHNNLLFAVTNQMKIENVSNKWR